MKTTSSFIFYSIALILLEPGVHHTHSLIALDAIHYVSISQSFPTASANILEGDGPSSRRTHGLDDIIRGRCSSYSLCVTKDFREEADISVQPLHPGKQLIRMLPSAQTNSSEYGVIP